MYYRNTMFIIITLILSLLVTPLAASAVVEIPNPIACSDLLCLFIGVMRFLLAGIGVFATFIFMWGGFLMLTSQGEAERVKKARDTLFWATMGIITVLGSWVFIKFVLKVTSSVT